MAAAVAEAVAAAKKEAEAAAAAAAEEAATKARAAAVEEAAGTLIDLMYLGSVSALCARLGAAESLSAPLRMHLAAGAARLAAADVPAARLPVPLGGPWDSWQGAFLLALRKTPDLAFVVALLTAVAAEMLSRRVRPCSWQATASGPFHLPTAVAPNRLVLLPQSSAGSASPQGGGQRPTVPTLPCCSPQNFDNLSRSPYLSNYAAHERMMAVAYAHHFGVPLTGGCLLPAPRVRRRGVCRAAGCQHVPLPAPGWLRLSSYFLPADVRLLSASLALLTLGMVTIYAPLGPAIPPPSPRLPLPCCRRGPECAGAAVALPVHATAGGAPHLARRGPAALQGGGGQAAGALGRAAGAAPRRSAGHPADL